MKSKNIRNWVLSAVGILILIMAGYAVYDVLEGKDGKREQAGHQGGHSEMPGMDHGNKHGEHDGHSSGDLAKSEVKPSVSYKDGVISIQLKDQKGRPFDELEVNHEKLMHFILVSEDLKQYNHLHPQKTSKGSFEVKHSLQPGTYNAFVDIKPKNKAYAVAPLKIEAGSHGNHTHQPELKADTTFSKTIDGHKVSLTPKEFKAGQPVTLQFSMGDAKPEPYLGARGHVVVLDHTGEKYVHVHPSTPEDTKFETEFEEPGLYKLWAEFKINGKVITYPFIIEVKK
ncbi:hypothetical protein P4361_21485 [Fictibacillus sp. B-59209]|uniref:hypothetical protein n=1 Tax=Fictibacillus sp. B-59209 TaxID=3024873 RepID=UPI002E251B50|nr:hypothetical protein [Fictibacillus sp. B-59209]